MSLQPNGSEAEQADHKLSGTSAQENGNGQSQTHVQQLATTERKDAHHEAKDIKSTSLEAAMNAEGPSSSKADRRDSYGNRNRRQYILDDEMMMGQSFEPENQVSSQQKQSNQIEDEKQITQNAGDSVTYNQKLKTNYEFQEKSNEQKPQQNYSTKNMLTLDDVAEHDQKDDIEEQSKAPIKESNKIGVPQKGARKSGNLYDSHYIQTKQEKELEQRIERQKSQMLQSYIVQKDAQTLIVSQHVPLEFDGEADVWGEFRDSLFLDKLTRADSARTQEPPQERYMVAQTYFNKSKDGSLLDLFESPHMTAHMIVQYLHKQNKKHIIEYLINKLYREYRHDVKIIDFYLAQLCYMSITKIGADLSMPIERFVLQMAIKYQIMGLKALEWYNAWSQDVNMPYCQRAMEIYNAVETAIVNSCIPSKYKMHLLTQEQVQKDVETNAYLEYAGYRRAAQSFVEHDVKLNYSQDRLRESHHSQILQKPKIKDNENRTDLYIIEHEDLTEQEEGLGGAILNTTMDTGKRQNIWPLPATPSKPEDEHRKQVELDLMVKQNLDQFQDKKYKAEYLQHQQSFISNMDRISVLLKGIPLKKRRDHLMLELDKINAWMQSHIQSQVTTCSSTSTGNRLSLLSGQKLITDKNSGAGNLLLNGIKSKYRYNYHGILLPFEQGGGDDLDPYIMLRIVPELNQAFNTRERAPFKFVCEVIKLRELQEQEIRMKEQDTLFNKSPKNVKEAQDQRFDSDYDVKVQSPKHLNTSDLDASQSSEKSPAVVADPDAWETVSYSDIDLEGMQDPYLNKFRNVLKEYQANSEFAIKYESWTLKSLIVKSNDDVRQEVLALQLMKRLQQIFADVSNLPIFLRPYEIFVTGANSGFIEFIPDTCSIDYLKKKFPSPDWTLHTFFQRYYGDELDQAQKNFAESLAGYSIFCYLFNVKDRHNGNILLDSQGHLIHIDFGFFLQNSPGGMGFEAAPFKLTQEYIDILGGPDSPIFLYFKTLLIRGLVEVRKHVDELIVIIQIMAAKQEESVAQSSPEIPPPMPCFKDLSTLESEIRTRLRSRSQHGPSSKNEFQELVERIVSASMGNTSTKLYDGYQKMTNGIEP